ncbi:hypothetical protein [Stenotrophomonas sp. Iso1]|uniref:hypothetical protein n=1 Tax=Stenotrophomonas sp. Iso1 TaxID=2977283 RepID=UPI0022B7754F|nr:hypothetical protein [Stenotrophomonas sp. Iso1]
MSPLSALRPGVITGLILLACWLGWITTCFASLGQRPMGDETAVLALRDALDARNQLPSRNGAPIAIRLRSAGCDCDSSTRSWQSTAQAMRANGGRIAELSLGASDSTDYELLVLAADGRPLYAGPLAPQRMACAQSSNALANELPELLSERSPPLFLSPRCSC